MFVTRLRAEAGSPIDRGPTSDFWFMPAVRTASGVRVTPKSALTLSDVYACVKVLAESFAVMPFELFRNDPNGRTRTIERRHWLYRLFALRPNRFQNPFEWRLMVQGHLVLRGNAFNQISTNARGEITELLPLHPDRIEIELIDGGRDYRYVYTDAKGQRFYYTRGEVWHLRGMSDDGIVGLNPIELARESIGEGIAMQSYSARLFGNDARPPGWIENPNKWKDDDTKRKWRDSFQRMQSGANRGKVAVLDAGMKYHELGMKNSDAQFIEGRGLKVADIARMFRVPPHKVGDLSRSTNNNIESQSIEFWTDTMLPLAELWEASIEYALLGKGLGGPDDMFEAEFDMDRMMRGDSAARSAYYASRTQWGSMTPNEVREREGDQPLQWLDHTMRPVNMVRVDASGDIIVANGRPPADPGDGDPDEYAEEDDVESDVEGDEAPDARRQDRLRNVAMAGAAVASRWRQVILGNARRMARRLASGQATPPDVLAEALGVSVGDAADWLTAHGDMPDEDAYTSALMALATKDE